MRFWRQTTERKRIASIDDWYQAATGQYLFSELQDKLNPLLATTFGYYSLQIGCPRLAKRVQGSCRIKHQYTLDQLQTGADIEAHTALMPVASDSVDLVILFHHLSSTGEPHAILREAFRILIPEGKLIIIDFNPVSLWGLRHFFQSWLDRVPWNGHYFTAHRLNDWMQLLGFDLHKHYRLGYIPPLRQAAIASRPSWFEKGMKNWFPVLGALNLLVYSKNISPMTPVRHRWVARKIMPGKIARPSVGRGMKYDR